MGASSSGRGWTSRMVALRALRGRGLVDRRAAGPGSDAWSISEPGLARLDELAGRSRGDATRGGDGALAALADAVDGEDLATAAAATRALAARSDGHGRWLKALDDVRPDVHGAAVFALAEVARDLSHERLATLSRGDRPAVQAALAAYRSRGG